MSAPYYSDELVTVHAGDCLDVLATMPDCSVDAVVTDPPYGLGFMGREWDTIGDTGRGSRARIERATEVTPLGQGHSTSAGPYLAAGIDSLRSAGQPFQSWCEAWSRECLRVLKPGGYLLAFGGSRTWHRLASAVEDAGFEIRDSIAWLYGSGFPKSLDVSKAIDKAAGAEREVTGSKVGLPGYHLSGKGNAGPAYGERLQQVTTDQRAAAASITAPATDAAQQWQGWGTSLKPAFEPIVVGRKPLAGTVAANVQAWGTGALNIDGCRVEASTGRPLRTKLATPDTEGTTTFGRGLSPESRATGATDLGRWPTNVVLDSDTADELDRQTGVSASRVGKPRGAASGDGWGMTATGSEYDDSGGASRFFPTFRYEAKAPTAERPRGDDGTAHPTVKPLDLMRWLVRLVTPPGGVVLDPFLGSGTTAEACVIEGFRCIGIERETAYLPLITARLSKPISGVLDFGEASA